MALSLVYETHSLTQDNEAGIATGRLPGKLSAEGRRLATELGRRRRHDGIGAVFCSDLNRAVETARIAFEGSDIPLFFDWRLRECNYGDLNGAPVARVASMRRACIDRPFPGGQSYADTLVNTRAFLADAQRTFDGRRICVIAHVASKWALDVLVLGKALEVLVEQDFGWQEGWEYVVESSHLTSR